MQKSVYRMAADGLSREAWGFYHTGHRLVLVSYGIERRKQARGRFSQATVSERWLSSDERSYNSRLPRPTNIPPDVIADAAHFVFDVHIGWTNAESKIGEIAVSPPAIEGMEK